MANRTTCCPKDCPRRAVGCRTDCTDWQEHEKRKAERYTANQRWAAAFPAHMRREKNERLRQLRQLKH